MILTGILSFVGIAHADPAEEAWRALTGKGEKVLANPSFDFVENNPDLPNVLIYGDSISIGYTPAVHKTLEGKANVYRLHKNGGDTHRVIPAMKELLSGMEKHWTFQWDVIHFNSGLHDLKYVTENGKYNTETGKQVNPPKEYQDNLIQIIQYFKATAPKAKLIFATTTPVPENSRGRKAGDAAQYNAAMRETLKGHPEINVNDLFALTKPQFDNWCIKPGNVHFNEEGKQAQGNQVAQEIMKALR